MAKVVKLPQGSFRNVVIIDADKKVHDGVKAAITPLLGDNADQYSFIHLESAQKAREVVPHMLQQGMNLTAVIIGTPEEGIGKGEHLEARGLTHHLRQAGVKAPITMIGDTKFTAQAKEAGATTMFAPGHYELLAKNFLLDLRPPEPLMRRTIIVVSDDDALRDSIIKYAENKLASRKYSIIGVDEAQLAHTRFDKLKQSGQQIVGILTGDCHDQKMDGKTLIRNIRRHDRGVRLFLFSEDAGLEKTAIRTGATGFLHIDKKGIKLNELDQALQDIATYEPQQKAETHAQRARRRRNSGPDLPPH